MKIIGRNAFLILSMMFGLTDSLFLSAVASAVFKVQQHGTI